MFIVCKTMDDELKTNPFCYGLIVDEKEARNTTLLSRRETLIKCPLLGGVTFSYTTFLVTICLENHPQAIYSFSVLCMAAFAWVPYSTVLFVDVVTRDAISQKPSWFEDIASCKGKWL